MNDVAAFFGIALGVAVAVVYPLVRGALREEFPPIAGVRFPPWLRRYSVLFVFSLITAFVLLALYKASNDDASVEFWPAVVMGFGWEAVIEKLWPESKPGT